MLYYKAWLESRVRFLAAGAVLSLYCVTFVQRARLDFPPALEPTLPYTAHVWRGIYNGLDMVVFIIMAALLGLGGLERERELGTDGFTLALPVDRAQLLWPRVAVAMFEMAALAAIPLVVVPWTSATIGRAYPAADAARFAILFATTGTLWVSAGVLVSVAVPGSYASMAASLLALATSAAVFSGTLRAHPSLSPFNVMNGARLSLLDRSTDLFIAPLPWIALAAFLLVSATLLAGASAISRRRDF
jgi:ABC-type transport system involved in multi-copper enzyme maturation permease subunit